MRKDILEDLFRCFYTIPVSYQETNYHVFLYASYDVQSLHFKYCSVDETLSSFRLLKDREAMANIFTESRDIFSSGYIKIPVIPLQDVLSTK